MDMQTQEFIKAEIRRQINVILPGVSQNAGATTEDILNMYPGLDAITARPISRPFGFTSRSSDGTPQIVARMGDNEGNRLVVGHRDPKAPTDINSGESSVYSGSGFQLRVRNGKIELGLNGTYEPMVVGQTLEDFLNSLINLIVSHTHASPGAPPTNSAAFTLLQTIYLTANKILCQLGGRF